MADPVIWKYELQPTFDLQLLKLPKPGRILSAGPDPVTGNPVIWASVDPDPTAETCGRLLQIAFTGNRTPLDATLLATYAEDGLVFHIFEVDP